MKNKQNWLNLKEWKTLREWYVEKHIEWIKQYIKDKENMKGTPKRDGTGQGTRANKGRGGCPKPRTKGKMSKIRQRFNKQKNA